MYSYKINEDFPDSKLGGLKTVRSLCKYSRDHDRLQIFVYPCRSFPHFLKKLKSPDYRGNYYGNGTHITLLLLKYFWCSLVQFPLNA